MKIKYLTFLISMSLLNWQTVYGGGGENKQKPLLDVINSSLDFAVMQYSGMLESLKNTDELPRTINPDGSLKTEGSRSWTSGFFPGSLWYLYEYTGDSKWKKAAHQKTMFLEKEKYNKNTHDLGFMLYCSFGNGYRLTGNEDYKPIILKGSESLSSRFNPLIGCIQSWGTRPKWQFPVIIDNMMNLEMLFWSSKASGNPTFGKLAEVHANTTLNNHFRDDYSSYHVVSYDTITGNVEVKQTAQGYADESSWARGQAWGLYGFTMAYRETGNQRYLDQAIGIADFLINHPNLPADKVPYWDFNAPGIPNANRDASAAAIICSALLELQKYADHQKANEYLQVAEQMLRTLSSPAFLASKGDNQNFLLQHCVGHMPTNVEIDVPLNYADYYYLEALIRYRNILVNERKL